MDDQSLPARHGQLLRLTTAGSVDDGKSTLIGRLLADCGALTRDQMETLTAARPNGEDHIDFARVTDGLSAEREQGITIDVAYRYFSTPQRAFILADVPGHEQYTRNMVTGASNAHAALFLVDVRHGMTRQTRRHATIAALLGMQEAVFAINKMDLVDYRRESFAEAKAALQAFCAKLPFSRVHYLPVSAKMGDNVVHGSQAMAWYDGAPLLEILEGLSAGHEGLDLPFRLPIQLISRPQGAAAPDFRGYMGRIASGRVAIGDRVKVSPGARESRITSITGPAGPLGAAMAGDSVTVTLADQVDAGRGHMLAAADAPPREAREIRAIVCWLDDAPQDPRAPYLLRTGTATVPARIEAPDYLIDIDTLDRVGGDRPLAANDIGAVSIRLKDDIAFDAFGDNPATGAFIIIDSRTNATVAAGMIGHEILG
ncbi:MAG: GTP-binding protein [Alphaproteobacteria bacterium]|nr:GTP-binding protein [Alphaproteobacteria bacterium]